MLEEEEEEKDGVSYSLKSCPCIGESALVNSDEPRRIRSAEDVFSEVS